MSSKKRLAESADEMKMKNPEKMEKRMHPLPAIGWWIRIFSAVCFCRFGVLNVDCLV